MDTKYHIYRPGAAERETVTADLKSQPSYDDLNAIIRPLLDNQFLEHVSVLFNGKRADMFVDELGANKGLPINAAATDIYRAAWMKRHPRAEPLTLPAIYGTAIVFNRIVWF